MKTYFRNSFYEVAVGGAGPSVVTFQSWKKTPGLDSHGYFASAFLISHGYKCVGVKSEHNDWYQAKCFSDVLNAVRELLGEEKPILYGSSMGGYAAWAFSGDLDATGYIAVVPQISIDPIIAPWERRWPEEALTIKSSHGWRRPNPSDRGCILVDPRHALDAAHARAINEVSDANVVYFDGFGHNILKELRSRGQLKSEIKTLIEILNNLSSMENQ
jgi:pimeloyl-ACP methyl ester carboxylesterase